MDTPLRFDDPTNPARVYVIDELRVSAYTDEERADHARASAVLGTRAPVGWTHQYAVRWHAEQDGKKIFGGATGAPFIHRYGTPEGQALTIVCGLIVPDPITQIRTLAEEDNDGETD